MRKTLGVQMLALSIISVEKELKVYSVLSRQYNKINLLQSDRDYPLSPTSLCITLYIHVFGT